jgi:dTMP kinase
MFFSFDGIDGAGKSTQVRLFADALRESGYDVVVCRDPGSTALGERVRDVLLNSGAETPIATRAEMLLYMAARAQLVDEVIRPALADGKVVVSDRYLLANVVYQGHAGGLEPDVIWELGRFATGGIEPEVVFVLDIDPAAADKRFNRPLDRMESQGIDYRQRLRKGFLREAERFDRRIRVIDANRDVDAIHAEIWKMARHDHLTGLGTNES